MRNEPKTYSEDGKFYAVIYTSSGHSYYSGAFNCRSTAYRYSVRETNRHKWARANGMIYNTRH